MIDQINKAIRNFYGKHNCFADTIYMSESAYVELRTEAKAVKIVIHKSEIKGGKETFNGLNVIEVKDQEEPFILKVEGSRGSPWD